MDYKVEVIADNKMRNEVLFKDLSHPLQAIRKAMKPVLQTQTSQYVTIFLMNQKGETWIYTAQRTTNGYKLLPMSHDYRNTGDVAKVFSGATKVQQLV